MGDRGSRGCSRHPSGVRVVLRNEQRAPWARNIARVHDGQTEKLWDNEPKSWRSEAA